MNYTVNVSPAARRQIKKLSAQAQKRIVAKLYKLKSNPRPKDVTKLTGSDSRYRIRTGSYRILYEIEDNILMILVLKVGDRKEVYR